MPAMPSQPAAPARSHAQLIIEWLGGRRLAEVESALERMPEDHPLHRAAEALVDAADSDDPVLRSEGLSALFAGVVEPLNDGFTPAGRALYAHLMARIVWRVAMRVPALLAALAEVQVSTLAGLEARYRQARSLSGQLPAGPVSRVVVLSRVTIGADILLTSLALQRLHQRFPQAELVLLGDGKLSGLFNGLPQVRVRPLSYARRGPLRERLSSWLSLLDALHAEAAQLVLAPDSRLDQLGVLPVCHDQDRYLLWENLQPENQPALSLSVLFDRWLCARLGCPPDPAALPALGFDERTRALHERLAAALGPRPLVAVKLDHGGNPAKALPRAAEVALLARLRARGWRVLLDRGFGAEELATSDSLLQALGWRAIDLDESGAGLGLGTDQIIAGSLQDAEVVRFHGSIAGWAAGCACSSLAVSYDSVGHHLAAALGIPVVVAFTGHIDADFPIAWQPRGRASVTLITIATAEKHLPQSWRALMDALPAPATPPGS